jgi:hypothetical protein
VNDVSPTAVDHPPNQQRGDRRAAALGSGQSVSPEMGSSNERKGDNQ